MLHERIRAIREAVDELMDDAVDSDLGSLIIGELTAVRLTLNFTERFIETVENEAKEVRINGTKG